MLLRRIQQFYAASPAILIHCILYHTKILKSTVFYKKAASVAMRTLYFVQNKKISLKVLTNEDVCDKISKYIEGKTRYGEVA